MDTTQIRNQATRIDLFDVRSPQMRAFHVSWFAFFLAFFGWFGIAPMMAVVRDDLGLSKTQVGNTVIASVLITVAARLVIGWLCDRYGPRRTYTALLAFGSLPVMGIGLAQSYETFVLFRLAIGVIGASFVITQYHTSVMFAPNVVGTANATTAGWGNLGGGVTQIVMPLIFALFVLLGASDAVGWRLAMIVPGIALLGTSLLYWKCTIDAPEGNFSDLRARGELRSTHREPGAGFLAAARDYRVWALFVIYGACFGVELTINNVAALYFHDDFDLSVGVAGLIAGLFGLMNIFARTLGGMFGDRFGKRFGLRGRVWFLGAVLVGEALALMVFSQIGALLLAIPALIGFSIFVQMSEGATFSVVPFINRKALGAVSGIVGAGGNAGAVAAGFLFRAESLSYQDAFLFLGVFVALAALLVPLVRFSPEAEAAEAERLRAAVAHANGQRTAGPAPVGGASTVGVPAAAD